MSHAALALALALVAITLAPAAASADAVGIPIDCPPATRGDGCHGAEYCTPRTCTRDSECAAGMTCRDVSYCTRGEFCGGGIGGGDPVPVTDYYALCTDACRATGCTAARVCASATPVIDAGRRDAGRRTDAGPRTDAGSTREHTSYSCGCEIPGRTSPLLPVSLAGLGLGLAAILAARRR